MMRAPAAIVFGLLSGMMASAGYAQAPPASTIRGRVLAADTGNPIRNARVGIGDGLDAPAALTDSEGRFTLAAVPADQPLSAAKTGYAKTTIPASADLEIRLTKGAAITGRVLDDIGDPMPFVVVVADRIVRARSAVTFERGGTVETNDLGEYRLFGLAAGEFVVSIAGTRVFQGPAAVSVVSLVQPPHNYYPRAETPEAAQPIPVAAGEEKPGIDLTIAVPPFLPRAPDPQETPQRPAVSGVIEGRVSRPDGAPVRRGRVRLSQDDDSFAPRIVLTDDDGHYQFRELRAGSYLVTSISVGAAETTFGQSESSPRGELLTLKAGGALSRIDITLPRVAAIAGRVLDEYGDPMANANVRVERVVVVQGRRRLVPAQGVASRQTDDSGRYRLSGLPPGRYLVTAAVGEPVPGWAPAPWPGYARTYYPGTPSPDEAQPVEIGVGQQALTIDFALVRGHLVRVSGTARTADDAPLQGTVSLARSARSGAIATQPLTVRTGADGRFEIARVAPGEYVLQAATSRDVFDEGQFAAQFITVEGEDVSGLSVHLSHGSTIAGRLTLEGGDAPEDPDFRLSAIPIDPDLVPIADNAPVRARIHDDLTFELGGISGPRRLVLTHAPDGWMLKAIRVNGIESTDAVLPFGTADQSLRDVEVVVTTRVTRLSIAAKDRDGGNAAAYRTIVFSTDRARWYPGSRFVSVGVPGRDGTVTVSGLPPADYYVAAIGRRSAIGMVGMELADLLGSLVADAAGVTLTEGESLSVSVKAIDR
jgi:protocatechuate 3,4-dioxygenase beta subunit